MSAYADLSAGLGPAGLVPGDLAQVESLATNCAAYAEQLARTRQAISYIQLHGTAWTGQAADVYEAARVAHLDTLKAAVLAFEIAAAALATYAIALRDARTLAGIARRNFQLAQQARESCGVASVPMGSPGVLRPAPSAPPAMTGMPMTPEAAVAQLESARKSVRIAGEEAAKALRAAAALSPAAIDPDDGGGGLLHDLGEMVHDTVTGPFHLVHGYLDTLTTSFAGLGATQYAGTHGLPQPDLTPELHDAQGESLNGAIGTVALLGVEFRGLLATVDAKAVILREGSRKVPAEWGAGVANSKGVGYRWADPLDRGNGVRIDQGLPKSSWPSQRADHVVIRKRGRILGPDGEPIIGALRDNPQAHIPLSTWRQWSSWDRP